MNWTNPIARWRTAESAGEEGAAEKALGELFSMLSDPAPSAGFAAAVLQSIDAGRAPVVAATVPLALRWATVAAMIAAAYSVVVLPFALRSLGSLFPLSASVELLSSALVLGSAALASWLELWQSLAELDRVLLNIVSKPQVAASLVVALGVSLAALLVLSRLTASDRSREYV